MKESPTGESTLKMQKQLTAISYNYTLYNYNYKFIVIFITTKLSARRSTKCHSRD